MAGLHVGVRFRGEWRWYRTIPEYWFLDLPKWMAEFAGDPREADTPDMAHFRFGIRVLDERTAPAFLDAIAGQRRTAQALRQMLGEYLPLLDEDDEDPDAVGLLVSEFFPQLLVDFDRCRLSSQFTPDNRTDVMFESFVPDGWTGRFENFLDEVPAPERYWVIDGVDVYRDRLGYDPIRDWSAGW